MSLVNTLVAFTPMRASLSEYIWISYLVVANFVLFLGIYRKNPLHKLMVEFNLRQL